jgi:glutathione transport system ATP-binding protein
MTAMERPGEFDRQTTEAPLLSVRGLTVSFGGGPEVVSGLDFDLRPGGTLAIVGESGSGKSVTSLAVMGLVPQAGGRITAGRIDYRLRTGEVVDLASLSEARMRRLRGSEVAMIFQEPMTALNPVFTIGEQIAETILEHRGGSRRAALDEAEGLLRKVRLPDPRAMLGRYPHHLSGGMRQRVVIAMALSCRPRILIADEPTTALDVTVQAQILQTIRELQAETGVAVIFISHDMGVVAEVAEEMLVMYQGRKVEAGAVGRVFARPREPYTRMLLEAVPRLGALSDQPLPQRRPVTMMDAGVVRSVGTHAVQDTVRPGVPILQVQDLEVEFAVRYGLLGRPTHLVHAASRVSLELRPGETLALVGESGSGKSTVGKAIQQLVRPAGGRILFEGRDYADMGERERRRLKREVHTIFQDPLASLNPRRTVGDSIAEPIRIHGLMRDGRQIAQRVGDLLRKVGLQPEDAARYPHQFSGGQRQRICIARALASEARLVIADEAVSALDVSIQAQVVQLLMELQADVGLSYLFISHDMAVVEQMAHRIAIMYLGQIVEIGPRQQIIGDPRHSYTRRLLASVPVPDPTVPRKPIQQTGDVPSPMRPVGERPVPVTLVEVGPGHFVARE